MADRPEHATEASEAAESVSVEFRLVPPSYADAPAIYSNFIQAALGQHDLSLYFGWYGTPVLTAPPTAPQDIPVRPLMTVSIPLGILRGLIRVLESQASVIEASTGSALPDAPPTQVVADIEEKGE
jgi:hypothetical protein